MRAVGLGADCVLSATARQAQGVIGEAWRPTAFEDNTASDDLMDGAHDGALHGGHAARDAHDHSGGVPVQTRRGLIH